MDCAWGVLSILPVSRSAFTLGCGVETHTKGERLTTGKAAVLDQLSQLGLRHPCFIVGNRGRLSDIAGLDCQDWRKLTQALFDFTATSGKIEPFDGHRHRFHTFPLSCTPASFVARRN